MDLEAGNVTKDALWQGYEEVLRTCQNVPTHMFEDSEPTSCEATTNRTDLRWAWSSVEFQTMRPTD